MIKIKIKDPFMGKNRISFHGFYMMRELFRDYSIDITNSDDYDYMFIGAHDILDKGLDLQDSIDYGLETCSKITGDYFLFDGCDSTSLIGSYEVFEKSDAKLYKFPKEYSIILLLSFFESYIFLIKSLGFNLKSIANGACTRISAVEG